MLAMRSLSKNHLLAALPRDVCNRLRAHLELVPLELGASVYESGATQPYVYFPTDSIVSLLFITKSGASTEIAVVGNEGLVRIGLFMGGETTPSRAVVQSAGQAWRLSSKRLKAEFEAGGALQHLLLRYTQALITQMAQTAVCNRHHSIEQQFCRWLLLSADRLPTNVLTRSSVVQSFLSPVHQHTARRSSASRTLASMNRLITSRTSSSFCVSRNVPLGRQITSAFRTIAFHSMPMPLGTQIPE